MRVFKTKSFGRFAGREGIENPMLCTAIGHVRAGRIDADLGGGVIKQRIARPGEGKSGGFRSIILYRKGSNAFFVYGFAKNDRGNIRPDELKAFRKLASELLGLGEAALAATIRNGTIMEIRCNG